MASASQPALAGNHPDGRVGERAVGPVPEDLFGLGVVAVLLYGLEQGERRVGEDGVVAPGGEQLTLSGRLPGVEVLDAADDEPGGDRLALAGGEGGVFGLGGLGVGGVAA